ncbi:hypothetical protein, partial [Escherichia coli]|uniref:hypothetical protein n=1 Tax=Escherichia coli TaxID=562 RepID=UPI001BB053DB
FFFFFFPLFFFVLWLFFVFLVWVVLIFFFFFFSVWGVLNWWVFGGISKNEILIFIIPLRGMMSRFFSASFS